LANALGVAVNTVARWERGERGIPPTLWLAMETIEGQERSKADSLSPIAGKRTQRRINKNREKTI
jgi:hypothetical protein